MNTTLYIEGFPMPFHDAFELFEFLENCSLSRALSFDGLRVYDCFHRLFLILRVVVRDNNLYISYLRPPR